MLEEHVWEQEIDLRDYILVLWRWKSFIIALFIVAVIAAAGGSMLMTPVYEVSATLALGTYNDPVYTNPISVREILTSDDTLRTVVDRLGLEVTAEEMPAFKNTISISEIKNTRFLEIKVLHEDPFTARAIIKEMVNVFREKSLQTYEAERRLLEEHLKTLEENLRETEQSITAFKESLRKMDGDSKINDVEKEVQRNNLLLYIGNAELNRINLMNAYRSAEKQLLDLQPARLVEEPSIPVNPVKPRKVLNVAIAGVLSLMVGVFLAFVLEYFKNNPLTAEELKQASGKA
ncbi:YveK family protein [Calderihabitans maritimus]|uniref:Lipopolysaccharide biosynthesis protein n=1 Tax=Calderihabitans maritimus TaxID=1246530 RepID=A0A1Z5HXQ3_9FIRM|nr:Wzz/FepE/Etk N-terminal domain-containing protein [Calderihabitans maritimus]GAW94095.1 lipopolysaccharide biosynthesis protein [Calderihabitans maritimus]